MSTRGGTKRDQLKWQVAKLKRLLIALPNATSIHERVLALNAISAEAKRLAKRRAEGKQA